MDNSQQVSTVLDFLTKTQNLTSRQQTLDKQELRKLGLDETTIVEGLNIMKYKESDKTVWRIDNYY